MKNFTAQINSDTGKAEIYKDGQVVANSGHDYCLPAIHTEGRITFIVFTQYFDGLVESGKLYQLTKLD